MFDATGVFGVNECSVVLDTFSSIDASTITGCTKEDLFDLNPSTFGSLANTVGSFIEWTVENLEGSKFSSFALQASTAVTGFAFALSARFAPEDSYAAALQRAAQAIADKAKTFNGIEKVNYYKQTVDKIMKVTDFIQLAALIIMAFLVIVSVVVVANTVKLTVFARGDEISIMKYIGATNWFVRGPFLVEGIIIGLFSAIISVLIIALIYARIIAGIGDDMMIMLSTPMVPEGFLVKNIIVIFVALGVSIGACGSIISMRRFLDV